MAITLVQTTTNWNGSNCTFATPNTAGNLLILVGRGPTTTVPTDDQGNTWVKAVNISNGSNGQMIWYAANCKGASPTISLSAGSLADAVVLEYSGCATVSPLGNTNQATGSGTVYASGTIATTGSTLVIGGVSNETDNGLTDTPSGGFTDVASQGGNCFAANLIVSVNGTQTYGGTLSVPVAWTATVAAFKGNISISGTTGVSGATVHLTGDATTTAIADGSGNYSFTGLGPGNYVVTPVPAAGDQFSPPNRSVVITTTSVTGINFTQFTPSKSGSNSDSIMGTGSLFGVGSQTEIVSPRTSVIGTNLGTEITK